MGKQREPDVHKAWARLRALDHALADCHALCAAVPPSLAPMSARKLRSALKSLQGAVNNAAHTHRRAQQLSAARKR